jgi:hypothetical protein
MQLLCGYWHQMFSGGVVLLGCSKKNCFNMSIGALSAPAGLHVRKLCQRYRSAHKVTRCWRTDGLRLVHSCA